MSLQTVKIFIASSSELKADRDEFRIFISVENDRLHKQGIYLEILQWEYFLDAISDTRLQDEYNKAIAQCDIALCLFFTKVGKYTAEEFDTAYQIFKDTGKPKIWTYFKHASVNIGSITEEIMTLFSFQKKIGALGHFYTSYPNIDNLKYQFKTQLDSLLPQLAIEKKIEPAKPEEVTPVPDSAVSSHVFNETLTRRLIEAIAPESLRAKKFLDTATRMSATWETQSRFSDPAKEILAFSFVGVVGIQLRKLMAIGKEEMSGSKLKKYLQNCQLVCKRALQLVCFALISKLWDHKKNGGYALSTSQTATCKNFFDDEFESDNPGLVNLLKTLLSIYIDNHLVLPMEELAGINESLEPESGFVNACSGLQAFDDQSDKLSYTVDNCIVAESLLATVLESLKFLAGYKMVSIKSIGYFEMRNSKPHYLYNYTALGVDSKSNVNQEKLNYAEAPINTDAVLLYKGSYQQNLNLFPFVIDVNALAFEGGAKICFYTCYNNAGECLDYAFLEDNSVVNISNRKTLGAGADVNELLLDPKKRRDMRFDTVFTIFEEAKKAITGIDEEEDSENPF